MLVSAPIKQINSVSYSPSSSLDLSLGKLSHSDKSSIRSGIISHGEHAVDLMLVQAAVEGRSFINGFADVARQLCLAIRQGSIALNEKIDGSPSIVFGFNAENRPFVSYKGGIAADRKKAQQIFTSESDVCEAFKEEDPRRALYLSLVKNVLPQMANAEQLKDFLFQADLLFFEGDDRRALSPNEISICSNTIEYKIDAAHPLFEATREAKVAFVAHTISQRIISAEDGKIKAAALDDSRMIKEFITLATSPAVLAIDPFNHIKLDSSTDAENVIARVEDSLSKIDALFDNSIGPEFRDSWNRQHLKAFRVFNNSHLLPGRDGGIFSIVDKGQKFYPKSIIRQYKEFANKKYKSLEKGDPRKAEQRRLLKAINSLIKDHGKDFEALICAYYEAIKLQSTLDSILKPSIKSKLGGGPVEGHMLSSNEIIVKWIDRLDFTRKNNERWRGDGSSWSKLDALPAPFNIWKPGAVVIPMKVQPPHHGHIKMLKRVIAQHPDKEVIILASDKEPNLDGKNWKEIGAAPTKRDLANIDYRHTFSNQLRLKLLQEGLGNAATISVISTSILRDYLRRAKEAEEKLPIVIALGEKEKGSGRYDGDFKNYAGLLTAEYIPLQANGIDGTSVRRAIRDAALYNSSEALDVIKEAFAYIKDGSTRDLLISELIEEFRALHNKVVPLIEVKKKEKSAKIKKPKQLKQKASKSKRSSKSEAEAELS